jgi:hypothetical protein
MGRLDEAARLLERVVEMDRKYQLPKLEENRKRLSSLRQRLSNNGKAVGSHTND